MVPALVVLGAILTVLAIHAIWIERQALDTEEWVKTSDELLEDDDIQVALSGFLAEELQANVDVKATLDSDCRRKRSPSRGRSAPR